ncbi:Alpha/Beta hydrolase protein [Clohesyomyces aquaticus]|uniref:Alpha/Beta hydrolase protein n=1 Tax=Clohesyomyces aquaticus TaxID=1231657 RepID=A0A1Y2AB49_9PLEO|nr:Alpha/Beta hydrolase protein [Clohesyomyces aquaticus]
MRCAALRQPTTNPIPVLGILAQLPSYLSSPLHLLFTMGSLWEYVGRSPKPKTSAASQITTQIVSQVNTHITKPLNRFRLELSPVQLYAAGGVVSVTLLVLFNSLRSSPPIIPAPRETVIPQMAPENLRDIPYPLEALPGARDVDSPYGSTRVYEFGPRDGPKVLLIHGISTPCIALASLAHKLADKGCRVMIFDLFSRGHSSGPSATVRPYDSALYTSQILVVLQSSSLSWNSSNPFTIVGYSLGGALAADFTSYFPRLVSNLVLIAPGGIIRTSHITLRSRMLYSPSGLIPEWMVRKLVAQRLWTGPDTARSIEPEPDTLDTADAESLSGRSDRSERSERRRSSKRDPTYISSEFSLLPPNPNSTVGRVVDWQVSHHRGFVPAFISTIRHAPIHNQHDRWRLIGERMKNGSGPLRRVNIVLGENDPIIIADEISEDAREVLGDDYCNVHIVKGADHDVAIDRFDDVARVVLRELGLKSKSHKTRSAVGGSSRR